jgi:hypothetical protein
MTKTDFAAIYDQANFSNAGKLFFEPFKRNRFVPFANPNSWIVEKTIKRFMTLCSFALPGIFPTIRLKYTERLW